MKIVTILGARPQFIKAALISRSFQAVPDFKEIIIHTGQHFDSNMSDIFFNELTIPDPNYHLNVNQMNHGEMTGKMLIEIEKILIQENPDGVLVYGDTNSTLAGSLATSKLDIPIFHVEAGLRSFNRSMPEEINRVVTDHLSSLLFCPTQNAINILNNEGIEKGVHFSGDIMYDLFLEHQHSEGSPTPFVLVTIHRPANTDQPEVLRIIIEELEKIHKEINVIFPVHPRTEKKLQKFGIHPNFKTVSPLSYKEMVEHLSSAEMVLTDSGGVQKEAFFAKTKCITVRTETEWVELIDAGVNCLSNPSDIYSTYNKMKNKECNFSNSLYGDGNAAEIISNKILEYISLNNNSFSIKDSQ